MIKYYRFVSVLLIGLALCSPTSKASIANEATPLTIQEQRVHLMMYRLLWK